MMTKVHIKSYHTMADSELIKDPARVVPLLERLAKRHTPLTVRIPGHDEYYTSYIVDVDKRYLMLDELLPSAGHSLLQSKRIIQATAKLDGIDIRFTTPLQRVDEQNDVLTYYMSLPEQLEYRQRRLSYRVPIPMSRQLRVIIEHVDNTVYEGVLHDLSHGGAGMVFPDNEPAVQQGLLQESAIELLDDEWLYCAVELRYSKKVPSRKRQLIGARFYDLSHEQSRLVGRCINELEREYIRKRASV